MDINHLCQPYDARGSQFSKGWLAAADFAAG
jgi:hypothetical protein